MENYQGENQYQDFENHSGEPRKVGKGQKIAVTGLVIFAIFVLFMWSNQLKNNINGHFNYSDPEDAGEEDCADGSCGENFEMTQKLSDTDNDGISDWDELNVYGTSPYLEDSDSDGHSDLEEIAAKEDPLCPIGETCEDVVSEDLNSDVDIESEALNRLYGSYNGQIDLEGQGIDEEYLQKILSGEGDAKLLRQFLISIGFDEDMLNQTSDEDLVQAYKDVIQE